MSSAAIARIHVEPQHEQSPAPERERHLRALPKPAVRRAPRLIHGVIALGGLAAIVCAQLGLTVVISEGAYRLSALQGQSSALARSEQALGEDVAVLSSPQHVAIAAEDLGMRGGQPSQFLTLSGTATAGGPDAQHMQVPSLDRFGMYVPNSLLQTQPQAAAAVDVAIAEIEPYPGMLLPAGQEPPAPAASPGAETDAAAAAGTAAAGETSAAAGAEEATPGTLLPATAGE